MRYLVLLVGVWGVVSYVRSRRQRGRVGPRMPTTLQQPHRLHAVYRIVEHDGGWAYRVEDVFSESYPTRRGAILAADAAALAHEQNGQSTHIEYQDEAGIWHRESQAGDDRPDTDVAADGRVQTQTWRGHP